MHRTWIGAIGACLALLVAGSAAASDVVIDLPQSAARGILTAVQLRDEVSGNYSVMTYPPRDLADRALRVLREVYTPAQLAVLPAGVDMACPASGTFHAHYAQRLLDLSLTNCDFEFDGWDHVVNGPLQVKFKSDSFTPTTVATFNAGSDTQDLVYDMSSTFIGGTNHISYNIRLSGSIPFGRATTYDTFEGAFSHTISGTYRETYPQPLGMPGNPVSIWSDAITAADGSSTSGNYNYGDTSAKEDVTLNGTFTRSYSHTAVPEAGVPAESGQEVIGAAVVLRSLHTWNYNNGSESMLVSGTTNYTWTEASNLACANGSYTFATPTQWRHPDEMVGGTEGWNAGKLVVNSAATFTFTKNPNNSELGEMHVDLDIPGIGNFDYDGDSLWDTDLPQLAQCH